MCIRDRLSPANSVLACLASAELPARTKIYQKNGDILFVAKAYNGRCIMQWLAEVLAALPTQFAETDERMPIITLAMHRVCNWHAPHDVTSW